MTRHGWLKISLAALPLLTGVAHASITARQAPVAFNGDNAPAVLVFPTAPAATM